MPARWSAWAIYEVMETSDCEQVFIGITSDNHWRRFCEKFDRLDLLKEPSLKTNEDRVAAQEQLKPIVRDIIKNHKKEEILEICEEINIPFAPVAQTKDLFNDPQLNYKDRLLKTQLPDGRVVKLPRLPIEIGHHDLGLRMQPPSVGQHTREILCELGFDEEKMNELEAKKLYHVVKAVISLMNVPFIQAFEVAINKTLLWNFCLLHLTIQRARK